MTRPFVHLHVHSEYSILDGGVRVAPLLKRAKALGMSALTLTDHGNLFGAVEFYKTAVEIGIKPILGMEAYLAPRSRKERKGAESIYHLTLIALNNEGFKNLMRLSTRAYLEGFYYKPRIDKEILSEHSKGLIALSGCLKGEIPTKILSGDSNGALKAAMDYIEIFGRENFYLELMDLGLDENQLVNAELINLSKKLGVHIVATNDIHYLSPDDALAHDVLLCIQTGKKLTDEKRIKFETRDVYFRTAEEMWALFAEVPEALKSTVDIEERVETKLDLDSRKVHLPRFTLPEGYSSASAYLRDLTIQGLKKKMGEIPDEYMKRLMHELDVIDKMGYSGFFLIIWDIVENAKSMGIPVGPGRGSAVGSLVLYSLDVTKVDPLKYGLLFERFLNPDRVSPPDVDIDFADYGRDMVIDYVKKKYGERSVSQIITFGRMLARAAVRDVGRVLDISYSEVDKLAKAIPHSPDITIERAMKEIPEFRQLVESNENYKKVVEIAKKIEGLVRNTSTHAAGVVIAPGDIWEFTPLYRNADGSVSTQFDVKAIEELGLLKIDFLGLRTLTILKWTEEMIREKRNPSFDLKKIPMDDPDTFSLISRGDTLGVFQLESPGFQEVLKRIKPDSIKDLTAALALYRPGPLKSGMVDRYIRRKNGQEPMNYVFPELEEIIGETYGVVVYQEQVMHIAAKIAGFTMAQADLIRRAMGKKDKKVMDAQKNAFVEGAKKVGYPQKLAEKLFEEEIKPFAGYGFNKSHAAGYAIISYQTAYLKTHYPAEFMCANLSAEMQAQNFGEKINQLVRDIRKLGITILPPDINRSEYRFRLIDDKTIAYGLGAVKNVGESAVHEIVKEREKRGEYESLEDFLRRVDTWKVNKKVVESLIKSGAFDNIEPNRAELLSIMSKLFHGDLQKVRSQFSLFGLPVKETKEKIEWNFDKKLGFEKEALGFFLSGHPLDKFSNKLKRISYVTSSLLNRMEDNESVTLVGTLVGINRKRDRQGRPIGALVFEDYDGGFQALAFSDLFTKIAASLKNEESYLLRGRISTEEEGKLPKVILEEVIPLEDIDVSKVKEILVKIDISHMTEEKLEELIQFLIENPGDAYLKFEVKKGEWKRLFISRNIKVSADPKVLEGIKKIIGEKSIAI